MTSARLSLLNPNVAISAARESALTAANGIAAAMQEATPTQCQKFVDWFLDRICDPATGKAVDLPNFLLVVERAMCQGASWSTHVHITDMQEFGCGTVPLFRQMVAELQEVWPLQFRVDECVPGRRVILHIYSKS